MCIKKNNKNIDAIISLKDDTAIGEKSFKPILIAKKAEPQIADNIINKKKLLKEYDLVKNYILFLGCGILIFSDCFINSSLLPSHR